MNRSALIPSFIFQEASLFLFLKLLGFICKIFLELSFYFAYRLESFIIERIFLITRTSNNQIKQNLGSTENAIECQTVTAFLL